MNISSEIPPEVLDILDSDSRINQPEVIIFGDYMFIYYLSAVVIDVEQTDIRLREKFLSKPFWIRLGEYPVSDGVTDRKILARLALDILSGVKDSVRLLRMNSEVISYDITAEYSPAEKKFCHIMPAGNAVAETDGGNFTETNEPSVLYGGELPETSWRLVTDILKDAIEKCPDKK